MIVMTAEKRMNERGYKRLRCDSPSCDQSKRTKNSNSKSPIRCHRVHQCAENTRNSTGHREPSLVRPLQFGRRLGLCRAFENSLKPICLLKALDIFYHLRMPIYQKFDART